MLSCTPCGLAYLKLAVAALCSALILFSCLVHASPTQHPIIPKSSSYASESFENQVSVALLPVSTAWAEYSNGVLVNPSSHSVEDYASRWSHPLVGHSSKRSSQEVSHLTRLQDLGQLDAAPAVPVKSDDSSPQHSASCTAGGCEEATVSKQHGQAWQGAARLFGREAAHGSSVPTTVGELWEACGGSYSCFRAAGAGLYHGQSGGHEHDPHNLHSTQHVAGDSAPAPAAPAAAAAQGVQGLFNSARRHLQ